MTLDQISAELYEKNQELMQDSHYKIVRDFFAQVLRHQSNRY